MKCYKHPSDSLPARDTGIDELEQLADEIDNVQRAQRHAPAYAQEVLASRLALLLDKQRNLQTVIRYASAVKELL